MKKRSTKERLRSLRRPHSYGNAVNPKVSVVIPVYNEKKTLARVIGQAYQVHPSIEVVVVANGSTDGTKELAERLGAKVISFDFPLGHDVGRSVGAREAKGSIILFTDGDIVIPAKDMIPLVRAVERGVDVALNQYLGPVHRKKVHHVILAKHALNSILSRTDLKGASMTTIPHAISRKALERIGADVLSVPPKALAMAVHHGLCVKAVHNIHVGSVNPVRRRNKGVDPLGNLIVGDHLEAIHWAIQATNERANHSDHKRMRQMVR